MGEVCNVNNYLQREVDKLSALLQLSERKRLNQKVLYDKNLENLHEKLADFENALLKEQKEIQRRLRKKDQQIKVREDLAKALQTKLDSQFCKQCGYPTSKNKFDTDWEIDICEEKKPYRQLPPLSLPSPENLPNVSFSSNRQFHSKSKLSPVAEESEVASSSYLRNIHADQHPDRFHAVLTASLECLQIDHVKKNITPESEDAEEIVDETKPLFDVALGNDSPNEYEIHVVEPKEETRVDGDKYFPPRPCIAVESKSPDAVEIVERAVLLHGCISDYAGFIAISILETIHENFRKKKERMPSKEQRPPINSIQSFSKDLALGILSQMGSHLSFRNKSTSSASSVYSDLDPNPSLDDEFNSLLVSGLPSRENNCEINNEHEISRGSSNLTNGSVFSANEFGFENHDLDETLSDEYVHSVCNGRSNADAADEMPFCNGEDGSIPLLDNITGKPRSYSRMCTATETEKQSYSRVSTMVVPLVDQALLVAKTIVRRRSSTNFLAIDGDSGEKGKPSEKGEDREDNSLENISFNRRTVIELIDQAVEKVIPTVNSTKDNNSPVKNGIARIDNSPTSEIHNNIDSTVFNNGELNLVCSDPNLACNVSNLVSSDPNRVSCDTNLACCDPNLVCSNPNLLDSDPNFLCCDPNLLICDPDLLGGDANLVDSATLSGSIATESNAAETRENEMSKSKKRKNKKKKKKKKWSASDAGNRFPESVDQMETTPDVNTKNCTPTLTACNLDFSFDPTDVVTSSLNNSESEINSSDLALSPDEDKFSLAVDQSFNEMEASRGSTPDTLDGFQ